MTEHAAMATSKHLSSLGSTGPSLTRRAAALAVLRPGLLLALPGAVLAQPAPAISAVAAGDIEYLIESVAASGCEFRRNGSWHAAAAAASHMRDKYHYYADRQQISTAEQFIDRAGSRSEMTGQAYELRCGGSGGTLVTTRQWLQDKLIRRHATK
jgi:hypothetical protein